MRSVKGVGKQMNMKNPQSGYLLATHRKDPKGGNTKEEQSRTLQGSLDMHEGAVLNDLKCQLHALHIFLS